MLSAVRRGPALARALRVCAPRALQSTKTTPSLVANFKTTLPPAYSPASQVRLFQSTVSPKQANAAAQSQETPKSIDQFNELAVQGLVHPRIIHAITEKMGIHTMTDVQRLTIPHSIQGVDTLAQAKTGTGKTLAFLVPVLQRIMTNDPSLAQRTRGPARSHSEDIRAIIISPTRELAEQIAVEARKAATGTGIVVQTAVGGTRKQEGLARILREGCHILVATPGRLKDILSDYSSRVSAPNLDVLVLDEADRLLDDGFGPEIESIQNLLPDPTVRDRQTLMFSATLPREVMGMVRRTMKPGFEVVNTVAKNEVPTHLRVPQKAVFCRGFENGLPAFLEILRKYKAREATEPNLRPLKAIVYYNTTAEVQFVYEALGQMLNDPTDRRSGNPIGRNIFRMHSRLSQAQRTHYSEAFRRSHTGILISSDVTARGLDFPDVTHVIQMSVPKTRESYIHRLGRTGRANKEGEGWIIIHDEEDDVFFQRLGDLPIEQDESIETANVDLSGKDQLTGQSKDIINQVTAALRLIPYEEKETVYRVQMAANAFNFRRKQNFVHALNKLATQGWGLPEPPKVPSTLASKLGFNGLSGINIGGDERRSSYNARHGDRNNFGGDRSRFRRPQRDRVDWSGFSDSDHAQRRFGFDSLRGRR
ncbi:hypothetical protein UA08_08675 [Talaromyces atroroseus]|uniref:ATP-dependent RNA helicase n=1 Tax=Talaromyces atroroseus TaxID=1441469 RepID=A0A225ARD0_TALAT|nr:hypothetical protein UA08_08675 [Talaromyces atroroseus]OKL56007.1 hypothetical protein UA08_08675 [Talaromyces atroroseus]